MLSAGIVFLLALGALVYIYAGYPLLLKLIVWLRGARPVRHSSGPLQDSPIARSGE